MRSLLILTLLFQLSFADLLSRALHLTFSRLQEVVVSVDMPRVSEGRVRPTPAPPPSLPCAIGLSVPPVFVCSTPEPPSNGD